MNSINLLLDLQVSGEHVECAAIKISKIRFIKYCILQFLLDFEDDGEDESDGGWQQELQRRYAQEANFMAELRARQQGGPWDAPQGGQQQGYVGQGEEYVEKIQGNGDLTLGPFAVQV